MVAYHNMFYTPVYVAVTGGYFYAEGLDVMFSIMPDGESSMDMLRESRVDVIQTGISRSFMDLDLGKEDAPLHIAEINQGLGHETDGRLCVQPNMHRDAAVDQALRRPAHEQRHGFGNRFVEHRHDSLRRAEHLADTLGVPLFAKCLHGPRLRVLAHRPMTRQRRVLITQRARRGADRFTDTPAAD